MDRTTLSVAAPAIAGEFHWNPATMGLVFSSFLWTYWFCLIPWGWMSDRIGTRKVNGISVTLWSVAAMLTGAITGIVSMIATRLALGIGEAASLPTAGKVVRQWFPVSEHGLATAVFNAGTFAGPAVSAPAVAWLVLHTGWRASFVTTGGIGLVWVALWLRFFYMPSDCSWLPAAERDYLLAHTGGSHRSQVQPERALRLLLGHQTMWGLLITQGCCAYTMSLFLFWLPSYLTSMRHMSLMKASWFTAVPYMVAVILGILIGNLSDRLVTPESAKNGKRRQLSITFILLSTAVLLTNVFRGEYVMLLLVSLSLTSISSALTLNIALTNDLLWDHDLAGTALGTLILGGISGSLAAPIVTGYLVRFTRSFDSAFYLAGGLLFVGAATSLVMTRHPLTFPPEAGAL